MWQLDPSSPNGISKVPKDGYVPYFAGGAGKPSLLDSVNGKHGAVKITAGSNVTVDNSGTDIVISSSGGGGGGGSVNSVTAGNSTITIAGTASDPTVAVNAIAESQVTNLVTDLAAKAPLASPTFTGTVTVPTPSNGTDAANKTYVDTAVTGLLDFQGSTNASTNPNYPAANKGDFYIVSTAGKIGGASGVSVDIGDAYFAIADNAGGTQASVGTSWDVLEHNLTGALLAANNLSDLASAATARTNLGLGTLATQSGTFSGTSSGTNTGDQTTVTGNAGTATTLQTARTIGTLTGDVTSAGSSFNGSANNTNATVVNKINGVALSGLATGILKNTTTTGVPSIAVAADFPTLNQNTTGTAATVTTNANMTGDVTSVGNATTYANVVPAAKGGAGTVSGVLKANGSGTVSAATAGTDYQAPITLTTTGTSGAATLISNTLNIPQYSGGGGGTGDVVGPASATDGTLSTFDGTTGKLLKDGVLQITGSGSTTKLIPTYTGAFGIMSNGTSTAISIGTSIGGSTTIYAKFGAAGNEMISALAMNAYKITGMGDPLSAQDAATKNYVDAGTATLTNKTISGSSNTLSNIANASLTNSSVTIGSTAVALGATAATLAGVTLTTPVLGVATATSINKVTITAPATAATLTIPNGVTFTGPAASGTAMTLGNAETVTGVKSFNSSTVVLKGSTSGTTTLNSGAVAGTSVLTLPVATDTLVGKATTDTLTSKTIDGTSNTLTNIPASALGTGAIYLGSTIVNTDVTTTATSVTALTGLSATVTVPTGGRKVKVSCILPQAYNASSGTSISLSVWRGTVGSGVQIASPSAMYYPAVAGQQIFTFGIDSPSAGSVTYNVGWWTTAGTAHTNGANGNCLLLVESM